MRPSFPPKNGAPNQLIYSILLSDYVSTYHGQILQSLVPK